MYWVGAFISLIYLARVSPLILLITPVDRSKSMMSFEITHQIRKVVRNRSPDSQGRPFVVHSFVYTVSWVTRQLRKVAVDCSLFVRSSTLSLVDRSPNSQGHLDRSLLNTLSFIAGVGRRCNSPHFRAAS